MNEFARALLAATLAIVSCAAPAHEGRPQALAAAAAPAAEDARPGTRDPLVYFTDTLLTDQHERQLRFYSDLLKDRVVLLNVVFTSCEDACPLITRKLVEVRERLGARFGREVFFVSISIDPAFDSPLALRKFAAEHQADVPGWSFLTGRKSDVDLILGRLGQLSATPQDHSTLLIAGNVGAKRWSKIRPDAPPWAIAERLGELAGQPVLPAAAARR